MSNPVAMNLQRLRATRGMTQAELAAAAGISRAAYRAIEKGEATPRMDTVMAIAQALEVGLSELLTPVRTLSQVRFRARKRMKSRDDVVSDVGRWLERYTAVEAMLGEERRCALLEDAAPTDPVRAAAWARAQLSLGPRECIRDICGLLEDQGGIKVYTPTLASDLFFGLSVGREGGGPAVVVNTWERIAVERWIFSAAHELGHLVLHLRQGAYDEDLDQEEPAQESEADLFASHFLMPAELFRDEWQEARGLSFIDRVFKLKTIFRVSYKTVLYRISQEYDDRDVWVRFYAAYKRRYGKSLTRNMEPQGLTPGAFAAAAEGPGPVVRGSEEPERLSPYSFVSDKLERLVRRALEEERITMGRAAEILGCSLPEARELASGWMA